MRCLFTQQEPPSGSRPASSRCSHWLREGYSTCEIARPLWITEEAVRTHVRRLLSGLGARTRAQAVAIAYRDGLWARDGW